MRQEKKQTAVEFYSEKDTVLTIAFLQDKISQLAFLRAKCELLEEAIAMEREQIEEAYMDSEAAYHSWDDAKAMAQQYYQRTYGKEADNE